MNISENCINLIKEFEGYKLKPYKLSGEQYYTVGFGHYGADVNPNKKYTKKEVEALLSSDLLRFAQGVLRYDKIYHFNQNELDGLVSFAYNVGSIDGLTAKGSRSRDQIAYFMRKYVKGSDGRTLEGLVKRREKERELFLTPVNSGIIEDDLQSLKGTIINEKKK